jgi:hypothetical protein
VEGRNTRTAENLWDQVLGFHCHNVYSVGNLAGKAHLFTGNGDPCLQGGGTLGKARNQGVGDVYSRDMLVEEVGIFGRFQ